MVDLVFSFVSKWSAFWFLSHQTKPGPKYKIHQSVALERCSGVQKDHNPLSIKHDGLWEFLEGFSTCWRIHNLHPTSEKHRAQSSCK